MWRIVAALRMRDARLFERFGVDAQGGGQRWMVPYRFVMTLAHAIPSHCVPNVFHLNAGDVVHRDRDGFFFVLDRLSNLILVNGKAVWPAQLVCFMLLGIHLFRKIFFGFKVLNFFGTF